MQAHRLSRGSITTNTKFNPRCTAGAIFHSLDRKQKKRNNNYVRTPMKIAGGSVSTNSQTMGRAPKS